MNETNWIQFLTLIQKEIKRFMRVLIQTLLIPLINTFLYLLIFGVSLGKRIQVHPEVNYLAFLIPGLLMMGVLNNAFQNSSSSIATSKFAGDLEDLRVVPLSPYQIVWALGVGGLIRGLMVGSTALIVGESFYWFSHSKLLSLQHPLQLIFFLIVGGLSFSFLGVWVAFRSKSIDQLSLMGGFILLPLMYLGGVFFSLENLHPFWQTLSHFNPMLYFINGVRFGMLGISDIRWETAAIFSLCTLAILYYFALRTVRTGPYNRW